MPRTNNENLISGTQAERISVSLDAEQLVKDTTTQSLFVGDGSTVGGRAVDVRPVSDITGNYTLVRADEGKILRFNSASTITITIPTNANVGYPVSLTRIPFINLGTGVVTLVGDTGVTLTSIEPNVDSKESGEIYKTATNTWFLTKGGSGTSQLTELTDVNITNLLNTQTLQYNTTSGKWVNVTSTDANTTYDLAVPASTTNLRLTGSDGSTDNVTLTGAGATSITRTSGTELTITSTDITYGVLIPTGTTSLRLLGSDASTDDISIVGGTNTTVTRTSDSILTLASDDTTYSLATSTAGSNATIDLTAGGSGSGTDSVTLAAGSNITISETGDTITFAGTAGTVTNVTGSSPISVSSGTTTPTISISQSDASTNGFLSSSDWSTFHSRLSSVGITSGGGLSVSGSPLTSNGSITLTNTGVTSNVAGTGISVSGATGAVTIANTDLGSSQNIFKTVAISGQDNIVADSNSDTLTLAEGSNITLTTNAGTDTITIAGTNTTYSAGTGIGLTGTTFSNLDKGSAQNIFKTIAVSGQSDIVADGNTDTLTFAAGSNVALTTAAGSDTLTIASTDTTYSAGSGLDLAGTTFSVDVSDFMANGVDNRILTASGADSINAESGLTYDGSTLNVGGSVIISSDLTVNGTTTTINTQTLSVDDPMVVVGDNNSANSVDLGIIGKYVDTNTYYSGLLRDASAGKFRLFTTTQDLSSATTVDPTNGGYANADLIAGAIQQSGATNGIVYADSNGNLLGGRTIAEGVGIDITNGSAVSGNPTIALDLSELTTSTSNADGDFFVVVDTGNAQKKLTKANINISGFNNDSGFTTNTGTVTSVGLAGDSGSTAITTSGTFTIAGGTNVTTSLSGSTLTIAATNTNTTYSAGDGLDLSGTTFSTDLKSNGGLVIESTELAVDLGASSITGTLAITDGGTGATSAGSARTNLGLGSLATLSSVAFSNIAPAAIQLSSESFTDVDTTLMTSAAIQDKILSYGYTTNTGTTTASNTQTFTNKSGNISQWTNDSGYTTNVGDITGVTAGQSLSGGGSSGSVSLGVADNGIGALQLNVSGNGSSGQALTSDGDGTFSWTTMEVGDITGITAGLGLSGGGTSGSVSLALDLHELSALGSEASTSDYVSIVDSTDNSTKKVLISNLPFGAGSGDITAVVAGAGLSGGATSGSATLSIPNQGSVSAGAYTNSNITVDARGIITDISTGSTPNNSTITVSAGTGLTGGGDFTTNQSSNETISIDIDSTVATLSGTQLLRNKTLKDPIIRLASAYSTTPDLSFTGDTNTGITHNGSNGFSFIHGGSIKTTFASTGLKINSSTYKIHADGSDKLNIWGGYDGSAAVRINDNYDLPITDGSANQIIQTDGSGTLSFVDATTGDITGVTAGTGLSGGGSSGSVTLNIDSSVATLTGSQTLTNKTLSSPILSGGLIQTSYTSGEEQLLISASSIHGALKVQQTGTGNSIEVHDEASDNTIFKVGTSGNTTIGYSGATSTSYKLLVAGNTGSNNFYATSDGTTTLTAFGRSTDTNTGMYFPAADTLGLVSGGSEKIRLSNSGVKILNPSNANLGYFLPTSDGSANQVIQTDGSGTLSFATISGSVGGSDTELLYNNGGTEDGISSVTYDDANDRLYIDPTRTVIGGNLSYSNGLTVNDEAEMRNIVKFADGTPSTPSITRWNNGDDNTGIYFVNPDVIGFTTGGTSRMTIAANGTVDVVGTLDTNNLTIAGVQGSDGQVLTSTGSGVAWETPAAGGTIGYTYTDTAGSEQFLISDNSDTSLFKIIQTGTGDALEVHDEASDTTVFKVDQSGHVQIGTTSESVGALRVKGYQGSQPVSGVSTNRIARFEDGVSGNLEITSNPSNGDLYVGNMGGGNDLILFTRRQTVGYANYENLRLTANGEIGIEGSNFGTSGQVLTSNGSGNAVSWTTVSGGVSFPLQGDSGSSSAPTYSFSADTDTGFYLQGASNMSFVAAGNSYLSIGSLGAVQFDRKALFNAATEAAPNAFATDTNTGFFQAAADTISLSNAGSETFRFGSSGEILIGGSAAGSSGQVLTSGGSGNAVSWTTVSGGSGDAVLSATQTFSGVNTFSNVVKLSNGSISAPALSFSTQTNQGIFRIGNGSTGITSSGQLKLTIDPYGITVGDGNSAGYVNAKGTQDLILRTNNGTNSSQIQMVDGANGDIKIDTNGTGSVLINYPTALNSFSLMVKGNGNHANPFHSAMHTTSTNQIFTSGQFAGLISSGSRTTGFGTQIEFRLGEVNYGGLVAGKIGAKMQDTGDANFDMFITPSGTGNLALGNFTLDADQSVGSGQDNYVMTYDHSAGTIGLEAAGGGGASAIGDLSDAVTTASNNIGLGSEALDAITASQGENNVGLGIRAGSAISTGDNNTALGYQSLQFLTTSGSNTAVGAYAGYKHTNHYGTFIGYFAGRNSTSGLGNTALGSQTMQGSNSNITGNYNTAVGANALNELSSGTRNIAIGGFALSNADTESDNIAIGHDALGGSVAGGEKNIAIGSYAGDAVTTADNLIAIGYNAAGSLTTGYNNADSVYIGNEAGASITNGGQNVVVGHQAGANLSTYSSGTLRCSHNVLMGYQAGQYATIGGRNVAIGTRSMWLEQETGYNTYVGNYTGLYARGAEMNTALGYGAIQGQSNYLTGDRNTGLGYKSLSYISSGADNIAIGCESGDNITSGSNNVVIGKADVASATGDDQLSISSGDGGVTWITGASTGVVDFPNGVTSGGSAIGGSDTDSSAFKFTASSRVPMMNGMAGNITNISMNGYYAYGNLVSFTEDKTLTNAWIYINSLSSGSADTGVTTALYELADSVLTDSSPNGTLIATATWAASKFVTASGSTGYNSESWVAASGQSLTLDSSKYYVIITSNWANNQQTTTPFNILAWTTTSLPNISGSGGNVGVSNGFGLWVNGSTSPPTSASFSNSGSGAKSAIWSTFT